MKITKQNIIQIIIGLTLCFNFIISLEKSKHKQNFAVSKNILFKNKRTKCWRSQYPFPKTSKTIHRNSFLTNRSGKTREQKKTRSP